MYSFIQKHWLTFWPTLLAGIILLLGLVFLVMINSVVNLYWIFIGGGFAVGLHFWYIWLNERWLTNRMQTTNRQIKRILFKIHIPHQSEPQSLAKIEMLFRSIQALHFKVSEKNKYFEGKALPFFSFEIHSHGGRLGFFLRCREPDASLILEAFRASLPQIRLEPHLDPMLDLPESWSAFQQSKLNLTGSDFRPLNLDFYPIKTWSDIEIRPHLPVFDPVASLLSVFHAVDPDEHLILQFMLRPNVKKDWNKKGEAFITEFKKKIGWHIDQLELPSSKNMQEQKIILEMQQKNSQTNIYDIRMRFLAVSPQRDVNKYLAYPANFCKQLDGLNQAIIPDDKTKTSKSSNWFPLFDSQYWRYEQRHRQQRIYEAVRFRGWNMSGPSWVISAPELAALIHFPIQFGDATQSLVFPSNQYHVPVGVVPLGLV